MFDKPSVKGDIVRIILYGLGLVSISSMVYVAGPFLEIGGRRPLENDIVREVLIVLIVAGATSLAGFSFWRRRQKASSLADGVAADVDEDDSQVLAGRIKDALATLKKSAKGGATYLYDLPWYVLIGPPGSGKTTALVNSGLRFPLSGGATPEAIAGAGGTRYCDWWFTEGAVFIDTPGRYATQHSDAAVDKRSWFAFLDLLKKNRPRQPINGVLVAISIQDLLLMAEEERAAEARDLRARLLELRERLKVDFPVYALFTKADLIAGFTEFFADLDSDRLRSVFGATFQTADKKQNLVAEIPREFDALIERLNQTMLDRLQGEPNPANRVSLYGFPAQMAALKRPVHDFLNAIFEPTRYHSNANLRGFYFTSGTQEGTPIDQLINALVKNFGARETGGFALSGMGKSFFLYDLVEKVVVGEAAWVSTDPGAVRRAVILKSCAFALLGLLSAGAGFAMWRSYAANAELTAAADAFAREYVADPAYVETRQTIIADRDYGKVLGLLQKLRDAPTGYAHRDDPQSFFEGLAFGQRERLTTASVVAYRLALERLLRPRLLYRLEEVLEASQERPSEVYEALKVYLMLGAVVPDKDRETIFQWERRDWREQLFRGPLADTAKTLEQHLLAMLDLEEGEPLVRANQTLIDESQKTLARLKLSERAYEMLKSQARAASIPDWTASTAGGLQFDQLFEEKSGRDIETIRVPGFFTYDGFKRGFLQRLPGIADRVRQERWVLGKFGSEDAFAGQYDELGKDLLALYGREFDAAWRSALGDLKMKRLEAGIVQYSALDAATAANSPLKTLFESIVEETALTRERKPRKETSANEASAPQLALSELFPGRGDHPPGEEIEKGFRDFRWWVDASGPRRPIDELLVGLDAVKHNLLIIAKQPENAPQANATLAVDLQKLRTTASRLPKPFRAMMAAAVDGFEQVVVDSELSRLTSAFRAQVAPACQLLAGRYPFVRNAPSEIGLPEFGRLFAPNGVLDAFFKQSLTRYVDTGKASWTYRPEYPLTARLSTTSLRAFQQAAQIRDAFFPMGGTLPNVSLTVYPPPLSGAAGLTAKFEVNGQEVTSSVGTSAVPRQIQWPGGGGGHAEVSLSVEQQQFASSDGALVGGVAPTTQQPPQTWTKIERTGAWALFKLIDAAGPPSYIGDRLNTSFLFGRRTLAFGLQTGSSLKPLTLPALREFRCPTQL